MAIPFTVVSGAILITDINGNLTGISDDRLKVETSERYDAGVDAFGRKRVSTPTVLFSSTHFKTDRSDVWDTQLTGTATSTHLPNMSSMKIEVGTALGDKAIRQTYKNFTYIPTQSYGIEFTGNMNGSQVGTTKRMGYFDELNGLFFEGKDGVGGVVIRSNITGTPIDTRVARPDWDDPMDGTGESGININNLNQQIFFIDFQWLGSGTVRFGFSYRGQTYYCHTMHHANILATPYDSTGNLPIRYEIENTTATAANSVLYWTCVGLFSEGSADIKAERRSISNKTDAKNVPSSNLTPILSLKTLDAETYGSSINISALDLLVTTNDDIYFEVRMDAIITGASYLPVDSAHISEFDVAANGWTLGSGQLLQSGYISKQGGITLKQGNTDVNNIVLGQYIDRTPQVITIFAQAFSGSAVVGGAITFEEVV